MRISRHLSAYLKYPKLYQKVHWYKKSQWFSKEEIQAHQLTQLQNLITYAYENIQFYKDLWDSKSIDPNISTLKEYEKFPIITKEQLREAIKSGHFKVKKNSIWLKTTGSSGDPFKFPTNLKDESYKYAVKIRINNWYKKTRQSSQVRFWRGKYKKSWKDKIIEKLKGEYNLCIYDPEYPLETAINDDRIIYFIRKMNQIRPNVIDGYVSALTEISNFILTKNITLGFTPNSIVTGAERLSPANREKIEKAFKAKVFNRYGGTETSIVAHECENQTRESNYLHVQDDRVYLENNSKNELIFTDLTSRTFPFIRYNTRDLGIISKDYSCSCGREFSVIKSLDGRINEWFELSNGKKISSHIWQNYFKRTMGVKKYQIIQITQDKFQIYWIKNEDSFDLDEFESVKKLISNALANSTIEWIMTDHINPGPGGKFNQHIALKNHSK